MLSSCNSSVNKSPLPRRRIPKGPCLAPDWRRRNMGPLILFLLLASLPPLPSVAQQEPAVVSPKTACNGVFLSYDFISRTKEYPHLKNATAQPWSFNATATVLNTGITELDAWKIFIGFQNREILVSAGGATLAGTEDFPADVSNGTVLSGSSQTDLKTSIDTAGDLTQIQAEILLQGTQFGLKPPAVPMPKTIRLENDGFLCPAVTRRKNSIHVCCVKNPKFKLNKTTTKFMPRQNGDLSISYDVLQANEGNYNAKVTMENKSPLGRLDHWNLSWEWTRGEFIYSMKGAYTHKIDYSGCIYGQAGQYYKELDFSQVMNCDKRPVIADMPPQKEKDEKVGNVPNCCRNGSLLPPTMNATKSKAAFQLQVFKLPPDMNRTNIFPPGRWRVEGVLNPDYRCGAPVRVDSTEFPDPSGLDAYTTAIASWQIICNITRPAKRSSRCCVSFSSFYNESIIPCNTCACGCGDAGGCDPDARAMLLPPEALLVPFKDRRDKALAWAKIKRRRVPRPLPCPDNCGVSVNWHISTDYRKGWSARMTLFNWDEVNFEDWFVAVQMKKAYAGYENVYSFNGTRLPEINNTIFFQGLPGLNFLVGETNGTTPRHPRVPGKQQSVISFSKRRTPGINIHRGDGFPTRLYFNGEECALPTEVPRARGNRSRASLVLLGFITFLLVHSSII